MNVQEMIALAYEVTHIEGNGRIWMKENYSSNYPQFTQEFRLDVRPASNRLPKKTPDGGTIVDSPIGYRELTVWVNFGDKPEWSGPELRWLYMDRSQRWDGEQVSGGVAEVDRLREISAMLAEEMRRIERVQSDYWSEHRTFDGMVIDGYAVVGGK
ncbi:hypothetical protein [Paenibacillus sp. YN15]|uniref:hypothetical protein n=1 Tax=Paenibacillus sp. YN15 TaxID=1742774 RepID=UPI000DCE9B8A|nr:hypothetical protein [Paenibacillus sp. YN15]RAU96781.1 hypothetical protein DQG13_19675 [Paenibacillus sp. YN15]